MKIAIGTTSKLKIEALKDALDKLGLKAEIASIKTDSGVSNQPFGFDEIIIGARNRTDKSLKETSADIGVGIENGLVEIEDNYFDVAGVFVVSKTGENSTAFSAAILMPDWIIREIKENKTEVGEITKKLSGDEEKDGFKYFTNGAITRREALSQALVFAFAKIINKGRYLKS